MPWLWDWARRSNPIQVKNYRRTSRASADCCHRIQNCTLHLSLLLSRSYSRWTRLSFWRQNRKQRNSSDDSDEIHRSIASQENQGRPEADLWPKYKPCCNLWSDSQGGWCSSITVWFNTWQIPKCIDLVYWWDFNRCSGQKALDLGIHHALWNLCCDSKESR